MAARDTNPEKLINPIGMADLRAAAASGEPGALYELARHLERNSDVVDDLAEALKLYELAAEQGHAYARCNLGAMHEAGRGTDQDYYEAFRHYQIAALAGDTLAQNNLGLLYRYGNGTQKNLRAAVKWLRRSAGGNEPRGQANYGDMLESGIGCLRNRRAAFSFYCRAAAQGLASAQNSVGVCFEDGVGVSQDHAQAAHWYQQAAEGGHSFGQTNFARALASGSGLQKDEYTAVVWFRMAAAQNNEVAQYYLACMLRDGLGCTKNEAEAFALFKRSADAGHADAASRLGSMWESGTGCTANLDMAITCYRRGAALGSADARTSLLRLDVLREAREGNHLKSAFKQLGWYSVLLMCIGGLSLFDILESAVFEGVDLSWAFRILLEGYRRITDLIGAVFEPIVFATLDWISQTFGWRLQLQPEWRSIFVLSLMPLLSFARSGLEALKDANAVLRKPELWIAAAVMAVAIGVPVVGTLFLGSVGAGLIPVSGEWWAHGLSASMPWLALVSLGFVLATVFRNVAPLAIAAMFGLVAGLAFVIAAAVSLIFPIGAGLIALSLTAAIFGALFIGVASDGLKTVVKWDDALAQRVVIRGSLVSIGGCAAALLLVVANWILASLGG